MFGDQCLSQLRSLFLVFLDNSKTRISCHKPIRLKGSQTKQDRSYDMNHQTVLSLAELKKCSTFHRSHNFDLGALIIETKGVVWVWFQVSFYSELTLNGNATTIRSRLCLERYLFIACVYTQWSWVFNHFYGHNILLFTFSVKAEWVCL